MPAKPTYEALEQRVRELEQRERQRQESEKALRQSEGRLRRVIENAVVGFFSSTPEGRFTSANPALAQLLGYDSPEELVAAISDIENQYFLHPKDREVFQRTLEKRGFVENYEFRAKRRDDSVIWVSESVRANYDAKDNIASYEGVVIDITERKRAERGLEISLAQLQTTLDATADGILVVNRDGKIVISSKRFAQMWNLSDTILSSRDDERALKDVLDQLEDPLEFLAGVKALYAEPEAESFDTVAFRDGRFFERYSRPHLLGGKVIGRVWSFRDVTLRRRVEAELQERETFLSTLLNAMPIPVFYKDRAGRYLGFNKSFESFFGQTRERMIGKTAFEINPQKLAAIYHAKDEELFRRGGTQRFESQVKDTRGELHDVIFHKSVFTDSRGAVAGLIGGILDITERKRAEQEKETLISDLQKALKEVRRLSGMLPICSHCKKVRNDEGYWSQIDAYVQQHSDATFSHGICPGCAKKHYPQYDLSGD